MSELDEEFLPLPHFPYLERPSTIPLEVEEAATALYLNDGNTDAASARLKCHPLRLQRLIDRSPRLQRLHRELVALMNNRVLMEYKRGFDSDEDRRREWAASKLAQTDQFQSHPLAPRRENSPSLSVTTPTRIIISWDDGSLPAPLIEHDGGE